MTPKNSVFAALASSLKFGASAWGKSPVHEIANTILFLASDLASHITLQDIVVNGS